MNFFESGKNLIDKSGSILLTASSGADSEIFSSLLALRKVLEKKGKIVYLLVPAEFPPRLNFLPGDKDYFKNPQDVRSLAIYVEDSGNVWKVKYTKDKEGRIVFFLIPRRERITKEAVSLKETYPDFDLIVTLGVQSLSDLKEIQEKNAKLLYDTPVLNIDTDPDNKDFGEVNIVRITSSSVSELTAEFLKEFGEDIFDKDVSTLLLTGIILGTDNFQNLKTTPESLSMASFLIRREAEREKIIRGLFKEKPFSVLKLLGEVLSRAELYPEIKTAVSFLKSRELKAQKVSVKELVLVHEDFRKSLPDFDKTALLVETREGPKCILASPKALKKTFASYFNAGFIDGRLFFAVGANSLAKAEERIINLIKSSLEGKIT